MKNICFNIIFLGDKHKEKMLNHLFNYLLTECFSINCSSPNGHQLPRPQQSASPYVPQCAWRQHPHLSRWKDCPPLRKLLQRNRFQRPSRQSQRANLRQVLRSLQQLERSDSIRIHLHGPQHAWWNFAQICLPRSHQ